MVKHVNFTATPHLLPSPPPHAHTYTYFFIINFPAYPRTLMILGEILHTQIGMYSFYQITSRQKWYASTLSVVQISHDNLRDYLLRIWEQNLCHSKTSPSRWLSQLYLLFQTVYTKIRLQLKIRNCTSDVISGTRFLQACWFAWGFTLYQQFFSCLRVTVHKSMFLGLFLSST